MRTWTAPRQPELPGTGQPPKLLNTATNRFEYLATHEGTGTLYVCGITPYDATHLGHAFTYLTYDLLLRAWRDAGITTNYSQNITDIDDPLLERANETGVNWRDLADEQIGLYRSDMHRLGMLPPDHFVPVTDVIDEVAEAVHRIVQAGLAYEVATPDSEHGNDIYFDVQTAQAKTQWRLGDVAPYDAATMNQFSAERGGDPDRAGKHDPIDPLLWRAGRKGEPNWDTVVGFGRPGWHVECAVIATDTLGPAFSVQGGGKDLIFPHHEFSAATATALTGTPLAHLYSHTELVGYQGGKMSKSVGNLVFVSQLLDQGAEGSAIRLALLAHHYRSPWEWQDSDLEVAEARLQAWREGYYRKSQDPQSAVQVLGQMRAALANDLDTPVMIAMLDSAWGTGVDQPELLADAVESLLGITVMEKD
ncbi:MAG: cysteine--1-D-myo-inosityl 2-amino-2-deoxy-alpha-D-glucopyranoside ligase [Canibacter sp.]